jgi:hypothetical protein
MCAVRRARGERFRSVFEARLIIPAATSPVPGDLALASTSIEVLRSTMRGATKALSQASESENALSCMPGTALLPASRSRSDGSRVRGRGTPMRAEGGDGMPLAGQGNALQAHWCPGPDSNRYGVASEGFSYPLQLSLPTGMHRSGGRLESGLSLCRVPRRGVSHQAAARVRQGPSSLYTFLEIRDERGSSGLARDCRHAHHGRA